MNLSMRLEMKLEQRLELSCEQRLEFKPHSPIENPSITIEAENIHGNLDDILAKGKISQYEKMVSIESLLLQRWKYAKIWRDYLDSPLIAHASAVLSLKDKYDAVVGIKDAGIPYATIFEMFEFPIFEIDYSHHKRNMDKPLIKEEDMKELKRKKSVLITDIDIVTGKTLREVTGYLRENQVNICGAYIGLFKWPGIKSDSFFIGEDTTDFERFWKGRQFDLSHCRFKDALCEIGFLPSRLNLYTSNRIIGEKEIMGCATARKIAKYFKNKNE